jgi:hypothetical protein
MISNATKRSILRWIHLIFAIPILGYIYSPFAELPNYAAVTRFVFAPVIILAGYWMFSGVFFAIIGGRGMARRIRPVWNWDSHPESGRAIHRAEDLVGDSCATFESIGLTQRSSVFRVLFNQVDPRQLFFRIDIFRRRKILRMVQTAGGNVDLIRPTVGLVGE